MITHHEPVWVPAELRINAAGDTRPGFECAHELENGNGRCGGNVFGIDDAIGRHACVVADAPDGAPAATNGYAYDNLRADEWFDLQVAAVRREGWAEAVEALRDEKRYEEWNRDQHPPKGVRPKGVWPHWVQPADRAVAAAYLESLMGGTTEATE